MFELLNRLVKPLLAGAIVGLVVVRFASPLTAATAGVAVLWGLLAAIR